MPDTMHFFKALKQGERTTVESFLKNGLSVDTKHPSGMPLLNMAAMYGHSEIVDLLLKRGANPELKTESGFLASHTATICGYLNVLQILAQHNIQFFTNSPSFNRDELCLAIERGHLEIIKFLSTQPGIDYDKKDMLGLNAVELARKNNQAQIEQLLITLKDKKEQETLSSPPPTKLVRR
jgi:ankyrin repeat protein